ncbi:MAG: Asp-tRNA(Asn)/Glu-tRNA(Gln) amidotransferase GatCAB subunit B, partial [Chloroflexota bacterium]|nr:Asp-tRNA(Asn)/Glu-tRNA(Gln) amidotransferase GatCAB subunit B [Chloroflexota bacterium]
VVTGDGELVQETRGWNDARGVTVGQRTKEQAHDYRYFPEPDLPPLTTNDATRALIRSSLPELPAARYRRFVDDIDLAEADAAVLTNERAIADIYEETLKELGSVGEHQLVANWMVNDVMALARARSLPLDQLPLSAVRIAELVALVRDGKLTARAAKDILPQLGEGESVVDAATRLNLLSLDDSSQVLDAARAAVAENPAAVADYKGGKGAAIGRLIGDTMRRTGGRAKPDDVRAMVLRVLNEEA